MHRDGLNQNLIIMDDKGKFIEMKQMRYGTSRQRKRVNALKELAKDGIIKLETDERFQLFWDWYQEVTTVQEFSGKTKEIFKEIMSKNQENIIEGRENTRINALIYLMRYQNNSGFSITDIRARIMTMTAISEKFTRDMDEA